MRTRDAARGLMRLLIWRAHTARACAYLRIAIFDAHAHADVAMLPDAYAADAAAAMMLPPLPLHCCSFAFATGCCCC